VPNSKDGRYKCVQGFGNGFPNIGEQQFLGTQGRKQRDPLYTSGFSSRPAGLNGMIFAHPTPHRRDIYLCLETVFIVMTGEELLASSGQRPVHMATPTARNYAAQIVQRVMVENPALIQDFVRAQCLSQCLEYSEHAIHYF